MPLKWNQIGQQFQLTQINKFAGIEVGENITRMNSLGDILEKCKTKKESLINLGGYAINFPELQKLTNNPLPPRGAPKQPTKKIKTNQFCGGAAQFLSRPNPGTYRCMTSRGKTYLSSKWQIKTLITWNDKVYFFLTLWLISEFCATPKIGGSHLHSGQDILCDSRG